MKEKTRFFIKENQILLIFFGIALIVHLFLPLNWADDAVFLKKTENTDILAFLNGSARPFTDGLTYIFTRNQWLWRIFNPCILTVLCWAIPKTAPVQPSKKSIVFVCIAAVFPTMIMVDAGFVATTVNYLWPVAFGILNLLPLIDSYYGEKTNTALLLLLIPMLIYTTNMQQMCAVLLAIFLFANAYFIFKKNFKPYIFLQLIITLFGTAASLFLNFTGDNSRMFRETSRYFPDFAQLNLFEKAELGFSSTFYCMTMETRFAFAFFWAFSFFLSVIMFKRSRSTALKVFSVFPPAFATVFGVYSLIPDCNSTFFEFLTGGMKHFRMEKAFYSFEPVPDILFLIICIILICCIWNLIETNGQKVFAASAFLLGLGSRMLMGFSPTVWASGYRTYCIMFIAFIYIVLMIISNNKNKSAC